MTSDGAPRAGVPVHWSVAAGGGSIEPISTETDAEGLASAAWTLGPAGENAITAAVAEGQRHAIGQRGNAAARIDGDTIFIEGAHPARVGAAGDDDPLVRGVNHFDTRAKAPAGSSEGYLDGHVEWVKGPLYTKRHKMDLNGLLLYFYAGQRED